DLPLIFIYVGGRRPLGFILFPYTPLFRSWKPSSRCRPTAPISTSASSFRSRSTRTRRFRPSSSGPAIPASSITASFISTPAERRSEEHTSELQSRENLVCRLLLEKKKLQI